MVNRHIIDKYYTPKKINSFYNEQKELQDITKLNTSSYKDILYYVDKRISKLKIKNKLFN